MIEEDARLAAVEDDLGVHLSRYGLWTLGSLYALGGLVGGPITGISAMAYLGLEPATASIVGGVIAVSAIALGTVLGLVHFVTAWGLADGKRWAWMSTLALAALTGLWGCLPIMGLFLWGMLNDRTRSLFRLTES